MTSADYDSLTQLNIESAVGDPWFLEHARTCSLPTQECTFCREGWNDFAKQYIEDMFRWRDQVLPFRAKFFLWYLDRRHAVLQRLWMWGWIAERPKWTI